MKKYLIKYGALFITLCILRFIIAMLTGAPFVDDVSLITLIGLLAFAVILDIQNYNLKKKKRKKDMQS